MGGRACLLIILLYAVGCAHGDPFFRSRHEYEYEYEAKLMSGIPKLGPHYAGLTIQGNMILQAMDMDRYKIAMRNISFSKFNEELDGPEPTNWRTLRTPEPKPVQAKVQSILDDAIEFTMTKGVISDIKVNEHEPEWSLNCLKALASLIKLQVPVDQHDLSQNLIRSNAELPRTWKTMEEGLDGKCENTYNVIELPDYMLPELDEGLIEKCSGKKLFQIEKSRDINKCSERTAFQINQPGRLVCPQGNCGSMWQRSSLTRYIGCGESAESMELHNVINEGEIQQSLMAYNTEYVLTGTRQTMKLKEVRTEFSYIREFASPRSINDLQYEYPKVVMEMRQDDAHNSVNDAESENEDNHRDKRSLTLDDNPVLLKVSSNSLFTKIIKKLVNVVIYLKDKGGNFGEKMVSSHVLSLSKLLSLLKAGQLAELYIHVKGIPVQQQDKEDVRQLFLEVVVMSGTDESVKFVTQLIQTGEVSLANSAIYLAFLPHYLQTPTLEVLEDIFILLSSPAINQNSILKTNAELSFAVLLNRACVDRSRVERFPIYVFGEFCNSQTSALATKYIPYFANQLQSATTEGQKGSLLRTLGLIGHESIIPLLLPYIEGKARSTLTLQRIAIYSLESASKDNREMMIPIMSTLVHNPSGDRSVRIAALSMLLTMKPSLAHFQRLAASTWFEEDPEFKKFVYSTLKSLSEIDQTQEPSFYTTLNQNAEHAKLVIDLAQPVPGIISSSLNHFTSEWLRDLEVGYEFQGAYVFSGPTKSIYTKLEYSLQQLKFTPIEFSFNSKGASSLMEKLRKILNFESNMELNLHPELSKIFSSLPQGFDETSPINIGFWARLFSDIHLEFSLNDGNLGPFLQTVQELISNPENMKKKVCGMTPINLVKVNNWTPSEILIPSEIGLPILMEVHMPTVTFTEGEFNFDCSNSLPSISLNITQRVSASFNGYIGTICPFTREVISTGIDQQWSIDLPFQASAKMEMGRLVLASSSTEEMPTESIDLVTYSIRPFSSVKPLEVIDSNPPLAHRNTKIIKSEGDLKTETFPFGRHFGLDLLYEIKTESDIRDFRSVINQLSLYNFNPVNVLLYSFTSTAITKHGRPSCRYNEIKIKYNPRKSSTKAIDLVFSMALASKEANQSTSVQAQFNQNLYQDLYQAIDRSELDTGMGLQGKLEVDFKGDQSKAYKLNLTILKGKAAMKDIWDIHFNNEGIIEICMNGNATVRNAIVNDISSIPTYDVSKRPGISLVNKIGFGKTCQEHQVKMIGYVYSINKRQEHTDRLINLCREADSKMKKIKKHIKKGKKKHKGNLEKELIIQAKRRFDICSKLMQDYQTLDGLNLRISHSNIPQYVLKYTGMTEALLKSYLMPYLTGIEAMNMGNEIIIEANLSPDHSTADMLLGVDGSIVNYANIRVPDKMTYALPLKVTETVVDQVLDNVLGGDLYSECRIEDDVVSTFDKKLYKYELDDCYHVLTAHRSEVHPFAVTGRKVHDKLEVQLYMEESVLSLRPSGLHNQPSEVHFNGSKIEIESNNEQEFKFGSTNTSVKIHRSAHDVLTVRSPYLELTYAGDWIKIKDRFLIKDGQTQGLCGDNNGDQRADVQSANACAASSYQNAALSYRLLYTCPDPRAATDDTCHEVKPVQPAVSKLVNADQIKCSQQKHSIVRQGNKFCFSNVPLLECAKGCVANAEARRTISYTCLPAAVAKVIQQEAVQLKTGRGQVIPKLQHMQKSFTTEMLVPVSCVHPTSRRPIRQ